MEVVISFFESTFLQLIDMGERVINIASKSIYEALYRFIPSWVITALPDGAVEFLQSYSLAGLMFGSGIIIYIGFVIGKFLLK